MGILVTGLRQQQVKSVDEAVHLLSFGEEYRVAFPVKPEIQGHGLQ
jgi:hypothetical protein